MVTPAARREAVAYLRVAFAVSERRACFVIGADRTSVRYRSLRLWGSFLRRQRGPIRRLSLSVSFPRHRAFGTSNLAFDSF
jgi:hypothetical protein